MNRGVVIASFGENRERFLAPLFGSLKAHGFSKLPIVLYTDSEMAVQSDWNVRVKVIGTEDKSPRRWIHLTNQILAHAAYTEFDSVCCLNDDMVVMSEGALDGFALAERFGVCAPLNPRVYAKYNAMGADAGPEEYKRTQYMPMHGPAYNVSPMFACRNIHGVVTFLETYRTICQFECARGTLAFWWAMWRTGFKPLALPEQWCVCGSSARFIHDLKKPLKGKLTDIEPMMLHWGQAEVREAFWWTIKQKSERRSKE
jgi:hypothetical protein